MSQEKGCLMLLQKVSTQLSAQSAQVAPGWYYMPKDKSVVWKKKKKVFMHT